MITRLHRKVWIAWGRWWAVQLYVNAYVSLGVHLDVRRPLLDLHLGWLIVSLGRRPETTPALDAQRSSCRGFFVEEAQPWL